MDSFYLVRWVLGSRAPARLYYRPVPRDGPCAAFYCESYDRSAALSIIGASVGSTPLRVVSAGGLFTEAIAVQAPARPWLVFGVNYCLKATYKRYLKRLLPTLVDYIYEHALEWTL